MSTDRKTADYWQRRANIRSAPKADMLSRALLIAHERGLTEKQMQKFYVTRRKGATPRFDYHLFAKMQNIDPDWLWDGDLRAYPRAPAAIVTHCRLATDSGDAA